MQSIFDAFKKTGNLHHAYCFVGERGSLLADLHSFLERDLGIAIKGNPDFWVGEFDSFGIEEGRSLKEMQERRAFGDGKKIFILATNSITLPAQNSLLKVFEEPTENTHFFLIMPNAEALLPTLRSRLSILKTENSDSEFQAEAKIFLNASKPGRLDISKKMAEEVSDEKKTKADVIVFLHQVEFLLRKKIGDRPFTKLETGAFEELLKCQSYLSDPAPSTKMLLEHISLVI